MVLPLTARSSGRRLALLASSVLLALLIAAPASRADGPANGGLSRSANPLAGMTWGGYRPHTVDPTNDPLGAYWGNTRSGLIARVIGQSRARWFGSWVPTFAAGGHWGARQVASNYVADVTHGNSKVGVQLAIFRLTPFEHQVKSGLPNQKAYKAWVNQFLAGIPSGARMALVLQPDLPIALQAPDGGKADFSLIRWTIGALKAPKFNHTTVYLDAGSSDWLRVGQAASMLRRAGVANVRGFVLNMTHYQSNGNERNYGNAIVGALNRAGVHGEHFIVNTALNGHPFNSHNPRFHNAPVCRKGTRGACVAIGHPFTTSTGSANLDAYMWAGRWWYNNAGVRSKNELLALINNSPFRNLF